MSTFQILMFAATLFFAYQIYRHVQNLQDDAPDSQKGRKESNSASTAALVAQADAAYERGDTEEARNLLEEGSRRDPSNPEICNKLAFVTAKRGDSAGAIELYERSLELEENDDLTHNAIASLYRLKGAYERSQDHYLKALEIDDQYAQTYYNYANLLVDMGETEQARSLYERALELDPDFTQARDALRAIGRDA